MLPDRRRLGAVARLSVATPLYGLAAGVTAVGLTAKAIAVAVVLGTLLAGVAAGSVSGLPPIGYAAVALLVGTLALLGWVGRVRRAFRARRRLVPAVSLLDATAPGTDTERAAAGVLSGLAQGLSLPTPALRVVQTDRPLSFTLSYPGEGPPATVVEDVLDGRLDRTGLTSAAVAEPIAADHVVVVSTGLLDRLSRAELSGVLAHELAHLRNGDPALVTRLLVPAVWAERVLDAGSGPVGRVVGTTTLWLALAAAALVSRGREFAADRAGAALTGDPASLASALEALADDTTGAPVTDLRAVSVLNVLPATGDGRGVPYAHPSTDRRVERLRELAAEAE